MAEHRAQNQGWGRGLPLFYSFCGIAIAICAFLLIRSHNSPSIPGPKSSRSSTTPQESDASVFAGYAKSASCKSCHPEQFHLWERSHHALAERAVNVTEVLPAFEPNAKIHHGSHIS